MSRPVDAGGLGFTHKWNMGWMHDTLDYWSTDPLHRRRHHNQLTFGLTYAWAEHFVLPLSHDEVVHLKRPLLGKMPGADDDERFANLRALYAWMWAHPGKQLLFMGGELAEPQRVVARPRPRLGPPRRPPPRRRAARSSATSTPSRPHHPALLTSATATRPASPGSPSTTRPTACSPSSAACPAATTSIVCMANLQGLHAEGYRIGLRRPGRWRGLVTTDDARYGGSGGWVPHLDAEPVAVAGPRPLRRAHAAAAHRPLPRARR